MTSDPVQAAAVQLAVWSLSLDNHSPTSFASMGGNKYGDSAFSVTFSSSLGAQMIADIVGKVNECLDKSEGATTEGAWFDATLAGLAPNRGQSVLIPLTVYQFGNVQPPTANDDYYSVVHDRVLNVPAVGILGNDTPSDVSLTSTLVTGPSHGSVALNSGGSFTYTPDTHFVGTDTFTYYASNGLVPSDVATVTIDVVNHPPSLALADQLLNEVNFVSLQVSATDPDGDALAYSAIGLPNGLAIDAHTGVISGWLDHRWPATYHATVTVSDGFRSVGADVDLTTIIVLATGQSWADAYAGHDATVLVTNTGTGTVRVLPDIGAAALSGYYGEPAIANGPYGLGTGASFDVSIAGQNGYAGDGSWSGDAESLTFTATGNVASIAISGDLTVHAGRNSGDLSGHNVGASAGGEIANIAAAANVVSLTAGGSIGAIQAGSAQTSATPPVPEFQDEWTRPTRPSFSSAGDILGPVNAAGSIGRVTVEGSILGSISAGRAIDGVWAAFDILGAITAGEGSLEVDAWGAIAGAITAEDAVNVWAFDALSGDVHAVNGKSDAGTWAERNGSVVGMTSASAFAFGNAAALLAAADAPAQPRKEVRADGPADLVTGEDVTYYQVVNNKDNVRIDAGKSVDIVESFAGKNMWVAAHEGSVKGRYSAEGWDYVRAYTDVDAHIEAKAIASVTAWNDLKGVVISADGVDAIVGRNLTGVIEAKSWVALEVGGDSNGPIKAGDGDTFGEVTASVGGNVLKPIESTGLVDLSAAGNVRSDVTAQKGSCSVILNPCRSCDYLILATTTPRTMTKSPRAVAQQALRLAQEALPAYSSKFSRKDCTQHQLFAPLSLKTFLDRLSGCDCLAA